MGKQFYDKGGTVLREMDLLQTVRPQRVRERLKFIKTRASHRMRPDEEITMLMKTARNRFRKSVEAGRIEIVNEREWTLR
jgi:hypothetical protein